MDTLELRRRYVQLTDDAENAYALREDSPEGYKYSDATIQRAIDEIENSRLSARPIYGDTMASYGPRAGVGMGRMRYMNSPSAAYENAQENLMDADMAYSRGDYGQMMQSLGGAAMQGITMNPVRRASALMSLVDYLRNRGK